MSSTDVKPCLIADAKLPAPLPLSSSTVLITGGSSGLGLALAKRFLAAGSVVIVTGRRLELLEQAKKENPALHIKQSDAGSASAREELFTWTVTNFPNVNILLNNAGIQRRVALSDDHTASWPQKAEEIEINLNGPIHLSTLFIPHFLSLKNIDSAVINVTSGLAYIPFIGGPTYAATKAGLHSYTMSLRWSLSQTRVRVIEIAPPAVKSNLGGSHAFGEDQDEWADHTFSKLVEGAVETGYKFSDSARHASRQQLDEMFTNLSDHMSKTMNLKPYQQ